MEGPSLDEYCNSVKNRYLNAQADSVERTVCSNSIEGLTLEEWLLQDEGKPDDTLDSCEEIAELHSDIDLLPQSDAEPEHRLVRVSAPEESGKLPKFVHHRYDMPSVPSKVSADKLPRVPVKDGPAKLPQVVQKEPERLPQVFEKEGEQVILKRVDMCAKAHEESSKIMREVCAQRVVVKSDMNRERQQYLNKLSVTQRERNERWTRKLQKSPFAVDLVAEKERIDEESRAREHLEHRRHRRAARRDMQKSKANTAQISEVEDLDEQERLEATSPVAGNRQRKALRSMEQSNARAVQRLEDHRKLQMQKEQARLQQVVTAALATSRNFRGNDYC